MHKQLEPFKKDSKDAREISCQCQCKKLCQSDHTSELLCIQ